MPNPPDALRAGNASASREGRSPLRSGQGLRPLDTPARRRVARGDADGLRPTSPTCLGLGPLQIVKGPSPRGFAPVGRTNPLTLLR